MLFLLFDGLLFWLVVAIAFIVVTICVETDHGGGATLTAIIFLLLLQFFSNAAPLTYLALNPWSGCLLILAYLAFGIAWGWAKWTSYIYTLRDNFRDHRAAKMAEFAGDSRYQHFLNDGLVSKDGEDKIRSTFRYNGIQGLGEKGPKVSDHKTRLITWMAYWPASFFWTVLNDPIRRFYTMIYRSMAGSLQRISDRAFSKV